MWRYLLIPMICLVAYAIPVAATIMPFEEIEPFSAPCDMTVEERGSTRYLSWSAVSGAATYAIGRDDDGGDAELLGTVTGTSYQDSSWNAGACYRYIMVAYDGDGVKICSAVVNNVGNCSTY